MSIHQSIRIVLVETSHPGNIGAAARAMKNMQLDRLYLVNPCLFPHRDADSRAVGADNILADAVICDSLEDALKGAQKVYGASARLRSLAWPMLDPREMAQEVVESDLEVALVFGRESSGLTNSELQLCHKLIHIPTNPEFSSLNVAAAVQVLSYELQMQIRTVDSEQDRQPPKRDSPLASHDQLEYFYQHLQQSLEGSNFLKPENPRKMMRRLRRIFGRIELEEVELNILRGILASFQRQNSID